MLLVLLLLCAFFSVATWREQPPTGGGGGEAARPIRSQRTSGETVRHRRRRDRPDDAAFADALRARPRPSRASVVVGVRGEPDDARRALRGLAAAGGKLGRDRLHAGRRRAGSLFDDLRPKFPALGDAARS